ncbi:MAG: hypothetical protein QQN64_06465, partial [Nitrosopumilus sp.]
MKKINAKILQRITSFFAITVLLSTIIMMPVSVGTAYWGYAFAEEQNIELLEDIILAETTAETTADETTAETTADETTAETTADETTAETTA